MRVLVAGAGVVGGVVAAKLAARRITVHLLATGERAVRLEQHGLVLEDATTSAVTTVRLPVKHRVRQDDDYDLMVVAVRAHRLAELWPSLSEGRPARSTLVLGQRVAPPPGPAPRKMISAFPGLVGECVDGRIRYRTGRPHRMTMAIHENESLATLFHDAGFELGEARDVDRWLRAEAFRLGVVASFVKRAGSAEALARDDVAIGEMVIALEAATRLAPSGGAEASAGLAALRWIPRFIARRRWRAILRDPLASAAFRATTEEARAELDHLARDLERARAALGQNATDIGSEMGRRGSRDDSAGDSTGPSAR